MKSKSILLALALLAILRAPFPSACAQGTAFTYQGRLSSGGGLAGGNFDLAFSVFDTNAPAGILVAGPITNSAVAVSNGLFTVTLDFGAGIFTGPTRWLEIAARTNGSGAFTTLAPRQPLTPTPYAIFANTASNVLGAVSAAQISGGTIGNSVLPGSPNFSGAVVANSFSGNGANVTNVNAALLNGKAATNFWQTTGNAGTSPANGNFLGTTDNQPLELWVNNSCALRLEPDTNVFNAANVIFGSSGNSMAFGVYGSFIGGGYANSIASNAVFCFLGTGFQNSIGNAASSSTIGGGEVNWIEAFAGYSTISGGVDNNIQYFAQHATIGGGFFNTIQTNASYATVSGGLNNTAGAPGAFVGGGGFDGVDYLGGNRANARSSAIVGGIANLIQTNANYSAIGGGSGNFINGLSSAIGGGSGNSISNNANYCGIGSGFGNYISAQPFFFTSGSFIGGGNANSIDTNGTMGYIGGGNYNYLNAFGASIGGGQDNFCTGQFATIPGGDNNVASGIFSFAAGYFADAVHAGSFVWADATGHGFTSTTSNQFAVYSTGGVLLNAGTNNVEIASGGLKVTGAGIGTSTTAFIQRATAANIEPAALHRTTINNPYCNGNSNALLIVTANYNPGNAGNVIQNHPYGVYYNPGLAKWQIFNEDFVALTTNTAFNVMIVVP